jgi:hypothetical protein
MSSILKTPINPKIYLRLLSVNPTLFESPSPCQPKNEIQALEATCHYELTGTILSCPPRLQPQLTSNTVYACCSSPYSTPWPPQIRHIPPCPFLSLNPTVASSTLKLICPNLSPTPRVLRITKDCEHCAEKHGRYGHGGFINARDEIKDGEWVLLRSDDGREKWMRIKREGWREWGVGNGESGDCEVVVRVEEGVDQGVWTVLR